MKLIDILVEELPKRGGWPKRANCITQDPDKRVEPATCQPGVAKFNSGCGQWFLNGSRTGGFSANTLASDYTTAIITRDQYEAALAAKNDGWIEWGGGKFPPVSTSTIVDVKFEKGYVQAAYPAGEYSWEHNWQGSNIIAYRLRQSQEVAHTEAEQEADLNECIGQTPAPVWSGEGLPPVGCVCERSWAGDKWLQCKIIFAGDDIVVVKLATREAAYHLSDVRFRPIRSEADRKRDESLRVIYEILDAGTSTKQDAADIYDAIAAGKIPGVKLED